MLSDRERRELTSIERALAREDPRFVRAFHDGRSAPRFRGGSWLARLLIGTGVLVLVVGVVAGVGTLFVQGLLLGAAGFGWSRWRARRSAGGPSRSGRPRRPRPEPGTAPPGWRRPF